MSEIDRVSAEELRHDRASGFALDYSPTYTQAVQNEFERLVKCRELFIDEAHDELVGFCEILQHAALTGNARDIQQSGNDFVNKIIKAFKRKAKDSVGEPWPDPTPTPAYQPSTINFDATFDRMFKEQSA